jgi:predicted  nucleic acid-binding Zn-ribbon protein
MRYTSKITANGKNLIKMHASNNSEVELTMLGINSYSARVTDTALGTIHSLEVTVRGFEEHVERLELDITDASKRIKELGEKVGAKFEREDRYQALTRRQSEIEEKLDFTKTQAPSQVEASENGLCEKPRAVHRHTTESKQGVKV